MKNLLRRRKMRQRVRRISRGLRRATGYTARLVGEGLIQNAGIAAVGAAALKLRGARATAPTPAQYNEYQNLAQFKKKGRPKGKKDSRPRIKKSQILTSKNKAFTITDKDIDKGLSRIESASKSYGNVARGNKNFVSARKEAALAYRYEKENSSLDRNIRRASKVVDTVDTARRSAQSIGLIRRSRTRGGNPVRRIAAGFRLLRRITG